jgi:hypothetical protein
MNEPFRTPADGGPSSEAEREARIEALLVAGLDHYFAAKYEQAINVWTRVAFLERGHGRARAYIERARGALAERQRETEELLHTGVAAYQAGDLQAARDLLNRAVDAGGANETALVFLERLGRLEAAAQASGPALSRRFSSTRPAAGVDPPLRTNWLTTVAASAAVATVILLAAQPVASWLVEFPAAAPQQAPPAADPLPVIRASETRVDRARQLHAAGRLRDALRTLEDIDIADPLRGEADRLKAEVQRDLLATISTTVPTPPAVQAPRGEQTR